MNAHPGKMLKGKWSPLRFKSAWKEYRYGSKPKKISLPQVFGGESRTAAIDGLMTDMTGWNLSPFEREGECRAGVRQTLCLQGHSWPVADLAAQSLVSECLDRMGAERPDWEQGQRHYSIPRENCARCGCEIDEEDQARGFRYCSAECAKAYRQHLSDEVPWDHVLRRAGYWQIIISQQPTKTCPTCDKRFKSRQKNAVYCSPGCATQAQRELDDRACEWCGSNFRPRDAKHRHCSQACGSAHRVHRWKTENPIIACACCNTQFRPASPKTLYCSDRCWKTVKNARRRATDFKSYEMTCTVCETPYTATKRHSVVCSPDCYKVRQSERDKAKRIIAKGFKCEAVSDAPTNVITLVIRRIEQIEEMLRAA